MNIKATYRLTCKRCGSIFDSPICVEYCSSCNSLPFIKDSNIEEPTLRDQFAMSVVSPMINLLMERYQGYEEISFDTLFKHISQASYCLADKMMEARKK